MPQAVLDHLDGKNLEASDEAKRRILCFWNVVVPVAGIICEHSLFDAAVLQNVQDLHLPQKEPAGEIPPPVRR